MFSSFTGGKKDSGKAQAGRKSEVDEVRAAARAIIAEHRNKVKGPMEAVNNTANNQYLRYGYIGGVAMTCGAFTFILANRGVPFVGSVGSLGSIAAALYGGPYAHSVHVEGLKAKAVTKLDESIKALGEYDEQQGQMVPDYYEEIEILRRMRGEMAPPGSPLDMASRVLEGGSQGDEAGDVAMPEGEMPTTQGELIDWRARQICAEFEKKKARKAAREH